MFGDNAAGVSACGGIERNQNRYAGTGVGPAGQAAWGAPYLSQTDFYKENVGFFLKSSIIDGKDIS